MSTLERRITAVPRHAGLIGRHPLLSFYVLAFGISWAAILIAVGLGPGGFSAAAMWVVVAALAIAQGGHLSSSAGG
jgi:hypothetical protein